MCPALCMLYNHGSTGGSDGDNLMRGRQVAPSGMVPPPFEDDVISYPPPPPSPHIYVFLASSSFNVLGGIAVLGPRKIPLGPLFQCCQTRNCFNAMWLAVSTFRNFSSVMHYACL